MANRRCFNSLTRQITTILSSSNSSLQSSQIFNPAFQQSITQTPRFPHIFANLSPICYPRDIPICHFSSKRSDESEEEEDDDDDVEEESCDDEGDTTTNRGGLKRVYTAEEKEQEAAEIGYKVIGPLERSDRVFKPYEPVFAVVQIGSHQFKVSNRDCIYTERLKFCEVNEKFEDMEKFIKCKVLYCFPSGGFYRMPSDDF